jgi:biotin carboxyl carrier protein
MSWASEKRIDNFLKKETYMSEEVLAPLSGKIVSLSVEPGTAIEEDDEILVIEAMKMETPIFAPCSGTVSKIAVKEGDAVEEDDLLITID